MDLISRQAAIDETWKEPSYIDPINVLTEVRERIKDLPSAQPEVIRCKDYKHDVAREIATILENEQDMRVILKNARLEPQWIPCSERLPEEEGYYLVTVRRPQYATSIIQVTYLNIKLDKEKNKEKKRWRVETLGKRKYKVIAWMLLPEAYKDRYPKHTRRASMSIDKRCDNCIFTEPDWTNPNNPDSYCRNEDSEEYGNNTKYIFGCEGWSEHRSEYED